jgi:hypothetical protein
MDFSSRWLEYQDDGYEQQMFQERLLPLNLIATDPRTAKMCSTRSYYGISTLSSKHTIRYRIFMQNYGNGPSSTPIPMPSCCYPFVQAVQSRVFDGELKRSRKLTSDIATDMRHKTILIVRGFETRLSIARSRLPISLHSDVYPPVASASISLPLGCAGPLLEIVTIPTCVSLMSDRMRSCSFNDLIVSAIIDMLDE